MNKKVVLILIGLAVLAGGLSVMRQTPTPAPSASPTAATPQVTGTPISTPSPATTPTPLATESGADSQSASPFMPPRRPRPVVSNGRLKAHIFSTSADGQARSTFPPGTESVYLVLTPEGIPERVDITASYRSALVEDADFSQPVTSSGSARRRVFRLSQPAGGWIPGPYQVMLKSAQGKSVFGHLRFEISNPDEKEPAPSFEEPEYLDLSEELKSEKRSVFTTRSPKIYLRVATYKIPQGTPVKTVWSAVEVDRLAQGELVAVSERSAPDPERDAIFVYSPPRGGFLQGAYKVDVYFDDVKVGSQAFFVQPPPPEPEDQEPE